MSAARSPPALEVEDLSVQYGDRPALLHVSLHVGAGEFVGLAGPNGSGKSTLLKAVLGLLRPRAGQIRLSGAPVESLTVRARARRAAWMPQSELPQENVPVLDYVLFGRYAHLDPFAAEGPEDRRQAEAALGAVDRRHRQDAGILELSGGERQRALLARALAQDAPLLLLDEPTAHLDIGHQLDLLRRVQALARERGTAVIAALHDLNLAARYVDRIVVLARGRLVEDGPPSQVLSPGILREVWGVDAELRSDPKSGQPYLIPTLPSARGRLPSRERGPVHVLGGGGTASRALGALVEAGWRVTLGVVPLFDSDTERAEELNIPAVVEVPFAAISEEARARLRPLLAAARAVVVAPIPVGPSNLANLEELSTVPGRPEILLLEPDGWEGRDFTEGRASALRQRLLDAGARTVKSVGELLAALDSAGQPPAAPPRPDGSRRVLPQAQDR